MDRVEGDVSNVIGLPMPKIYVIPTDSPNAFATGRNPEHAAVAVTTGLLNMLNRDEVAYIINDSGSRVVITAGRRTGTPGATNRARLSMWPSVWSFRRPSPSHSTLRTPR